MRDSCFHSLGHWLLDDCTSWNMETKNCPEKSVKVERYIHACLIQTGYIPKDWFTHATLNDKATLAGCYVLLFVV